MQFSYEQWGEGCQSGTVHMTSMHIIKPVNLLTRGNIWSRISVKILFYIFHRLFSFMIFLQGLFSWSFNSHGPAFSHGLFARSFLMVFSHGLFSWSFLMVFSHGLFSWSFLMVFSHGLFSWSLLSFYGMVFGHTY